MTEVDLVEVVMGANQATNHLTRGEAQRILEALKPYVVRLAEDQSLPEQSIYSRRDGFQDGQDSLIKAGFKRTKPLLEVKCHSILNATAARRS